MCIRDRSCAGLFMVQYCTSSEAPALTLLKVTDAPGASPVTSRKPDAALSSDALQMLSAASSASYLPVSGGGGPPRPSLFFVPGRDLAPMLRDAVMCAYP